MKDRRSRAVEVRELEGQERTEALEQFRPGLPQCIAQAIAPFAPAGSSVHADAEEAACVRADLDHNELKNSGELWRMEAERALAEQIKWGVL